MRHIIFISLIGILHLSAKSEKYLKIPPENIKAINLVLKDQFSGTAIETYKLDAAQYELFVKDLNVCKEAPSLKMNITCYRFDIIYKDGRKVKISTNGKGLGPTPVGYFLSNENLVLKYFPIKKERYCKPTSGNKKAGGSVGF
ncbi:MAG: hypothetical protein JXQ87_10775 [Bacteroidia bacterium]